VVLGKINIARVEGWCRVDVGRGRAYFVLFCVFSFFASCGSIL